MLYLAIDQHAKQITACVRNEDGDTVLRRQVSTRPEKIEASLQQLTEMDMQFLAILAFLCVPLVEWRAGAAKISQGIDLAPPLEHHIKTRPETPQARL